MSNKLLIGIKRHPKRFLLAIWLGYSLLWIFLEPIFSIANIKLSGNAATYYITYITISLCIGVMAVWPKKKVQFGFSNTNTRIEIKFGDLFQEPGDKVIAVTEFFDTKIGKPVSPNSVHGKFITDILGGYSLIIDNEIANQLIGKEIDNIQRCDGKSLKYEIGTTITVSHNQSKYFLVAFAKSDNDCKAVSTPSLMLIALEGLWHKVRNEGNGQRINIPLIGSGLSGIGLPPTQLIQLILISLLKFTKEKELSTTIVIVLQQDVFDKVDLDLIKNNWQ